MEEDNKEEAIQDESVVEETKGEQTKEQEYLQGWQRARAELDNFKKRTTQENDLLRVRIKQEFLSPLLEVADNFQAIVDHQPEALKEDSWAKGVVHVARQLENLLTVYGVTVINETGQEFDHNLHEAVEQEKGEEGKEGIVLQVFRPGYKIGEVVIRPAQVKVSV